MALSQQINQPASYRKTQIETASPEGLILMLYDGALRFLALAEDAFEKKDLENINNSLNRVQAIISELLSSLDKERGGDVAVNLERLYLFFLERLGSANVQKDPAPIREIKPLIEDLRNAWGELVKQHAKKNEGPVKPIQRLNIAI